MPSVTVETALSASAEEVWNFLCKINRYPKWDAFADEVISTSHSRLKAGSTFVERSGLERSEWRVTSFDAPRRQVHIGRVGFMGEVTRELAVEPAGEGSLLRQTISFKIMPGFAAVRLARRTAVRQANGTQSASRVGRGGEGDAGGERLEPLNEPQHEIVVAPKLSERKLLPAMPTTPEARSRSSRRACDQTGERCPG